MFRKSKDEEFLSGTTFKRKSSVPDVDPDEDYSKLIDNSESKIEPNQNLKPEEQKRRHKSSLSMIDEAHAKRLSKSEFVTGKGQNAPGNDSTFINPFSRGMCLFLDVL